jgi:hypothetical protein
MPDPQWYWLPHQLEAGKDYGDGRAYALAQSITTLVRETAQNSLDAAVGAGYVGMRFRLIDLPKGCARRLRFEEAVDLLALRSHLESVKHGKKPKEVADRVHRALQDFDDDEAILRLLVVEDYGAKGLQGDEFSEGSSFAALLRNTRDSQKQNEAAGGSFGLGSGTLWACSRFLTVLFASSLEGEDSKKLRVFGKAGLGYHEVGGDGFIGPGNFGDRYRDNGAVSHWAPKDSSTLSDLCLTRQTFGQCTSTGTSALIVAFEDPNSDDDDSTAILENIRRSVAENLWPAIVSGSLSVVVRHEVGDTYESASDELINVMAYVPSYVDAYEKVRRGEVTDALSAPGDVISVPVSHTIPATRDGADIDLPHDEIHVESRLVIRLASENSIDQKFVDHVACARGRAMVTQYWPRRAIGLNARPFHALLFTGTLVGNGEGPDIAERFFRNAEPPSHDRWEFWTRVKSLYAHGAKKLLEDFFKVTTDTLRKAVVVVTEGSDDGPPGLRNLVTIPFPVGGDRSTFRVRDATRRLIDGNLTFSATLEVDEPANKLFIPIISMGTDSGRTVGLEIIKLSIDDVDLDPTKEISLHPLRRKFELSGVARSTIDGLDLSRCALRIGGRLRRNT